MGAFIIGILVGWLAEWVFFTFFVKGKSQSDNNTNTSALQAELSSKNKEIKALQAKLADSAASVPTTAASSVTSSKKNEVVQEKTAGASTQTSTTASTKPAEPTSTGKKEKTAAKPATPSASKAEVAPASKATTKTPEKPVAKSAPKKATPKKTAAKAAIKTAPKKSATKKPAAKTKPKGDDFTKLSGIGPSMAGTLNELGIDTFKKLADMDDDILRDMLEASGARLNNNKEAMDSWNEQATLADKGDFKGLKELQALLKKK